MTRLTITATCNYRHNDVPFICFRSNAEESALINNLRVEALIGGCVPQLCECPSLCAEGTISRCREGAMLRCDSGSEDRRDRGGGGGVWPLSFCRRTTRLVYMVLCLVCTGRKSVGMMCLSRPSACEFSQSH